MKSNERTQDFLDVPEQDANVDKIKRLFSVGNPVEIDNVEVAPVFDRVDFYALDLKDFAIQAERRKVSMANGRVGVIMSYSTKGIPRDVKVTWDKFNDVVKTVDSVVFAFDDAQKAEFSMFSEDNTFAWNAKERKPPVPISDVGLIEEHLHQPLLDIPILSTVLALISIPFIIATPFSKRLAMMAVFAVTLIASSVLCFNLGPNYQVEDPFSSPYVKLEEQEAGDIFEQLHKNMFRAFDYHSESEIYDALARSVHGELLQRLYLEVIDSLRISEQGGGRIPDSRGKVGRRKLYRSHRGLC